MKFPFSKLPSKLVIDFILLALLVYAIANSFIVATQVAESDEQIVDLTSENDSSRARLGQQTETLEEQKSLILEQEGRIAALLEQQESDKESLSRQTEELEMQRETIKRARRAIVRTNGNRKRADKRAGE